MSIFRYLFSLGVAVLSGTVFSLLIPKEPKAAEQISGDPVEFGRRVYISEGCIHCHSQYVRPVGPDQELWGAPTSVERALWQEPVLIGNRRQGPDLANVGLRRSPGWNRLHLIAPEQLVPGSRMPSFRHLFVEGDPRGEALLAYLDALRPPCKITDNGVISTEENSE